MYVRDLEENNLDIFKSEVVNSCLSNIFAKTIGYPMDTLKKSYSELISLTIDGTIKEYDLGFEYIERLLLSLHAKGLFGNDIQNLSLLYNKVSQSFSIGLDANIDLNDSIHNVTYFLYEGSIKEVSINKEDYVSLYFHNIAHEKINIRQSLNIDAKENDELMPYSMENDFDDVPTEGLYHHGVKKVLKSRAEARKTHWDVNVVEVHKLYLKSDGLMMLSQLLGFLNKNKKVMLPLLNGRGYIKENLSIFIGTVYCKNNTAYTLEHINEDIRSKKELGVGSELDINQFLSKLEKVVLCNNRLTDIKTKKIGMKL